jgi:hypothetical protein
MKGSRIREMKKTITDISTMFLDSNSMKEE